MELVFVALPVALLIGGGALVAFVWAARADQFEDLDSPPERVLFDDPLVRSAGAHVPGTAPPGPSAGGEGPATDHATGLCVKTLDRR